MRYIVRIVFSALCIFGVENQTNGARILAITHIPSYSHQISFRPLWRKLVERGHELVLITSNSMLDTNATNCREIILKSTSNTYNINYVQMRLNRVPFISYLGNDFAYLLVKFSNYLFDYPEVRKLYDNNSKEKFDLVMIEMAYTPSLFAFAHRFNAPVIGNSQYCYFRLIKVEDLSTYFRLIKVKRTTDKL
ncbi:hypothetical protein K0M31_003040 [Melipona bicolor]|uniref:Ecdysteroid UDP-glucosyltransferase n=1 Tax=Melipona bicolor TaxID=60889 RepID=A0AA40G092_9HYME|nr:hypothetical protein K0M31_003040 [Melipona bicolor]